MPRSRVLATVAVVPAIDVEPMCPAVIGVGIPFLRGIGGAGCGGRDVVGGAIVAPTVAVVGTVGEASLELLDLLAKLGELGGLDSELLDKVLVRGLEAV